ncbi:MAG: DUF86 domain-containing protein [Prolixibacteraceae bacterium]|nr:DUF86 domain-containing protein [Prolixibacteraceae bacterium]
MDKPTPKERVQHVLDSITSIRSFMEHITFEMFSSDKLLQNGVKYEFLIIGEAIRHIDQDILDKYEYPWHIPRSFRNYIAHHYHGIKIELIFLATSDLHDLENVMMLIRRNEF